MLRRRKAPVHYIPPQRITIRQIVFHLFPALLVHSFEYSPPVQRIHAESSSATNGPLIGNHHCTASLPWTALKCNDHRSTFRDYISTVDQTRDDDLQEGRTLVILPRETCSPSTSICSALQCMSLSTAFHFQINFLRLRKWRIGPVSVGLPETLLSCSATNHRLVSLSMSCPVVPFTSKSES